MSLLEKLAIHFLTKGKKNITYKGTRVNRAATDGGTGGQLDPKREPWSPPN